MLQTFNVPALGRIVNTKATFFRYESSGGVGGDESIRVRADGQDLGTYLPGDSIELPVDASAWEITPVSPIQTCVVRLGLGRINTARLVGNVRVVDEVTDALQRYTFTPGLAIVSFQVTTVVAPASNARGMIFRQADATVQAGAGGAANMSFFTCKSTPTSFSVPSQRWNVCGVYDNAASLKSISFNGNKLVPPGWGLFAVVDITTANATIANGSVSYELL